MKCLRCSGEIIDSAAFCQHCGAAVAAPAKDSPKKTAGGLIGAAGPDDPEEILWQGTYSKFAMIGPWLVAAAATMAVLIAGLIGKIGGTNWLIVLGLLAGLWTALVTRLLILQWSTHYYLTNQRFIHERGLLWRTIDRIETIDVDDVICQQGPVDRLLGIGTIRLKSSDQTTPEFVLAGIENVRSVASRIDDARRKERRKRGVHFD